MAGVRQNGGDGMTAAFIRTFIIEFMLQCNGNDTTRKQQSHESPVCTIVRSMPFQFVCLFHLSSSMQVSWCWPGAAPGILGLFRQTRGSRAVSQPARRALGDMSSLSHSIEDDS